MKDTINPIGYYWCTCRISIDPVSLLEQALLHQQRLVSISDLNVENSKLRDTLEEYNKEFAHVKNQGEQEMFSQECFKSFSW